MYLMATTTMVHVRVDQRIKARASKALAAMGLSVSDAVRVLLTRVAAEKALPFNVAVPNAGTTAAMEEARRGGLKSFDSVPDLMADLNAEDKQSLPPGDHPAEVVRRLDSRIRRPEDVAAESSARAIVPALSRALKDAGATRVVLFGSLASGLFRMSSDIDLAVAGLPDRVLAKLERELSLRAGRPVELANLDVASPALRTRVEQAGRDLT